MVRVRCRYSTPSRCVMLCVITTLATPAKCCIFVLRIRGAAHGFFPLSSRWSSQLRFLLLRSAESAGQIRNDEVVGFDRSLRRSRGGLARSG